MQDTDFADLYPRRGQPAFTPWRLALITILQFREDLSDRAAAEAVRARIDGKYLLGLELTDPGFDASVLCEFVPASSTALPRGCCSSGYSIATGAWGCSRLGGGSVPTRPTCWHASAPPLASGVRPKRYGMP